MKSTFNRRQKKPLQITRGPLKGHSVDDPWHDHYQPHGISFKDGDHGEANIANAELVVRQWYQIENNTQPVKT